MSRNEMPRCFFGLGVGADQAEDPVAVLAQRRPRLLPVDDELVAVADRGRAQRGEVGAGVGLGEALRPPDVEVRGLRQEALLELLRAERRDHRADHRGVERQRGRHAGALHLLVPDVAAQRRPVLAAPLDRPVRHGEPVRVEHPLALDDLLLGQLAALGDGVADLLGHLRGEEGPHLVAERGVLGGQLQLHRRLSWVEDGPSPARLLARYPLVGRPRSGGRSHISSVRSARPALTRSAARSACDRARSAAAVDEAVAGIERSW